MSVFLALWRHPVMHSPHSMHALRSGPTPPKYGSGTFSPGLPSPPVFSPKNTPTGV